MKNIYSILFIALGLFSCQQEEITAEDHLISYDIEEVPVTEDYTVGALYVVNNWSSNIEEVPLAGHYLNGDEEAMKQHILWADSAAIDYFIFRYSYPTVNADNDILSAFLNQNTDSLLNFALRYNFAQMNLTKENTLEGQGKKEDFIQSFKDMIPYFDQPTYQKVDGKYVVNIIAANQFYCDSLELVYHELREEMSALGYDLYLTGEQTGWTPPARFEHYYFNALDAVTFTNMFNNAWYDRHVFLPQSLDQHWQYSKDYYMDKEGIELIPTVAPSINPKISNPNASTYIIERDTNFFWSILNVAKKNIGPSRTIIVNSFNDWNFNTQLEPADSYGSSSLQLLRNQTKKN
ncbi:glycoside hydrolase family 99-like domain-containing protein [Flammeovirga kamogawensis]|uniref:Glycoside hydrolase family 99-like domain-containing protein n=1 Tax=Flammeovirga kamogawensis TaxID=373891 RepID=A0ABX8H483_9BACT|nr:glycoside hydrolase family 99-like domain-containing protein [Flammeovirga kamogawensis]MBB6460446.1 hypothetical protein [Flammeovirga kamogawensis]QWG10251.1 glycoside hydrolase family 99-like domain-containing protein [Flammeovirga kamogawensis]TRX64700.1 hypothetical protein EO216_19375 [Flammeovirga kamogawensis]